MSWFRGLLRFTLAGVFCVGAVFEPALAGRMLEPSSVPPIKVFTFFGVSGVVGLGLGPFLGVADGEINVAALVWSVRKANSVTKIAAIINVKTKILPFIYISPYLSYRFARSSFDDCTRKLDEKYTFFCQKTDRMRRYLTFYSENNFFFIFLFPEKSSDRKHVVEILCFYNY